MLNSKSKKIEKDHIIYTGNIVIYVGETGVSLKARFKGNGNSSHCKKYWYKNITEVKYIRWDTEELTTPERKYLEAAITVSLKPIFYKNVGRKMNITS